MRDSWLVSDKDGLCSFVFAGPCGETPMAVHMMRVLVSSSTFEVIANVATELRRMLALGWVTTSG